MHNFELTLPRRRIFLVFVLSPHFSPPHKLAKLIFAVPDPVVVMSNHFQYQFQSLAINSLSENDAVFLVQSNKLFFQLEEWGVEVVVSRPTRDESDSDVPAPL